MGYAFVEFKSVQDALYAQKLLNGISLFGAPMRCSLASMRGSATKSSSSSSSSSSPTLIGALLFVGNLNANSVSERLLHETFAQFGRVVSVRIRYRRDQDREEEQDLGLGVKRRRRGGDDDDKASALIDFDCFEAADRAIERMHGQSFHDRVVVVTYARKSNGLLHGSDVERLIAEKERAQANEQRQQQLHHQQQQLLQQQQQQQLLQQQQQQLLQQRQFR
jgi:splicing factor 3B subunit 4